MVETKQSAALASVISSVILTVVKLFVGITTGSLGILAEAAHSLIDLMAAATTLFVVRIADIPPDENHPYGHARAEYLGALAETILLVITAVWILWHCFERIFIHPEMPEITVWSFAVMILSLVVDYTRAGALKRAAEKFKSQALAADAAHFTNDLLSSAMVLVGLSFIGLSNWLPLPAWLVIRADAFAAVLVALIALHVSWEMGLRAVRALMDDVPRDLNQRLVNHIIALPTVTTTPPPTVRTRFVGNEAYVEVTVGTARDRSLAEAHQLTEEVEQVVRADLEGAHVLVHVEPTRTMGEPHTTAIYAAAQRLGLRIHNLDLYQVGAELQLGLDLELPGAPTLAEALKSVAALKAAIGAELSDVSQITIHLEPRRDEIQTASPTKELTAQVAETLKNLPGAAPVKYLQTFTTDEGLIIALHCLFPTNSSIADIHVAMTNLERTLRRAVPGVARVQIEPQPLG